MKERLIEILKGSEYVKFECMFNNIDIGFIADHLLANGVIVQPVKVGQTVWYISFGKVHKGKCHAICLKPDLQIHLYDADGDNASIPASRVFATKEEAKRALAERSKP